MVRGLGVLMGVAVLAGCPTYKAECSSAGDCASLVAGGNSNVPPQATKYCEGGKCVDPPSGTSAVTINLTTPRNVPINSIRYAVLTYKGSALEGSCSGKSGCPGETVTCDDVKNDGLASTRFNVALGGVKGADTMNGTLTAFQDMQLGNVPQATQMIAVEGRSGQLGAGDRLAWWCGNLVANGATVSMPITLLVN